MTALADIGKAAAALHGDALRGSDLFHFNQEHPRDESGRFTSGSGGPPGDPRSERTARRLRRLRRGVRATQAQAFVAAQEAAAAPPDLRLLPPVTRQKLLPARTVARKPLSRVQPPRPAAQQQATDVELDDIDYLEGQLGHPVGQTQYIPITGEQAREFAKTGSLVVGAANLRWKTQLNSFDRNSIGIVADEMRRSMVGDTDDDVVILRTDFTHADEGNWTTGGLTLSGPQIFEPNMAKAGQYSHLTFELADTVHFASDGSLIEHPWADRHAIDPDDPVKQIAFSLKVIDIHASTKDDYKTFMANPPAPKSKPASKAMEWEAEEHPRDLRSGRFTRAAGGGPSRPIDPRIARGKRRRRRIGRAMAAAGAPAPAPLTGAAPSRPRPGIKKLILKKQDRKLVHKTITRLIPDLPEGVEFDLLTNSNPKAVHYTMDRNYDFAQKALGRVKAGTASEEDHVFLSDAFLSDMRTRDKTLHIKPIYDPHGKFIEVIKPPQPDIEHRLKEKFSEREIAHMERQLAASLDLFELQKASGATGWQMDLQPQARAQAAAPSGTQMVAASAEELEWLYPLSQGVDLLNDNLPGISVPAERIGLGSQIITADKYQDLKNRADFHQVRIDQHEAFQRERNTIGAAAAKFFTDKELEAFPHNPTPEQESAAQAELARRMGFPLAAERIEFMEARRQRIRDEVASNSDPRVREAHLAANKRMQDRWKAQNRAREEFVSGPETVARPGQDVGLEDFGNEDVLDVAYGAKNTQRRQEGPSGDLAEQWLAQNDPSHRTRKRSS